MFLNLVHDNKKFVKIWFAVMQHLDSSQGCGHSCVRGQVGYIPVTESSFCGYINNRIVSRGDPSTNFDNSLLLF